jgi:hypothetical protein
MIRPRLERKQRYYEEVWYDSNTGQRQIQPWIGESNAKLRYDTGISPEREMVYRGFCSIAAEHDGSGIYFRVTPPTNAERPQPFTVCDDDLNFPHLRGILAGGANHIEQVMDQDRDPS